MAYTVKGPYENTRKRVSRDGRYPWSVTIKRGALVETLTFNDEDEAKAFADEKEANGFRRL